MARPDSQKAYWALAALGPFALYAAIIGLLGIPFLQRQAVYAHRFHTLWWHDVDEPEKWGFAKHQVTPFRLDTPDGATLYLWHILPIALYSRHEDTLSKASRVPGDKYTSSDACRLLREDPEARLVVSSQNTRAPQYRLLSGASPHTHIIALDYRGYGHSTGSPTEDGLITDAATVINFVLDTLQIPPSRIVLLGQSLGTAVASATAEKFSRERGIDFAGVVLVASFSSLPTMLANYSLGGVVPLLRPLSIVPPLLRTVLRLIVDKWPTIDRLATLVAQVQERNGRLRLHLIHAADDRDIPCAESVKIFDAIAKASMDAGPGSVDEVAFAEMKDANTVVKGKKAFKATWRGDGDVLITHEQFAYGGHNDVMVYAPVPQAIIASFDAGTAGQLSA